VLYVSGLPPDWSQEQAEEYFGQYGELRCVVAGERTALVAYRGLAGAQNAFPFVHKAKVDGCKLRAELRESPDPSNSTIFAQAPQPLAASWSSFGETKGHKRSLIDLDRSQSLPSITKSEFPYPPSPAFIMDFMRRENERPM